MVNMGMTETPGLCRHEGPGLKAEIKADLEFGNPPVGLHGGPRIAFDGQTIVCMPSDGRSFSIASSVASSGNASNRSASSSRGGVVFGGRDTWGPSFEQSMNSAFAGGLGDDGSDEILVDIVYDFHMAQAARKDESKLASLDFLSRRHHFDQVEFN